MSNMTYKYVCPTTEGYERFSISRKDQDKIFKYRKSIWSCNYEYYVKDRTIKMYKIPSIWACLLGTILFPVALIFDGVMNYKEAYKECILHTWQCKKYGAFSADEIYKRESDDTFDRVLEARK